MKPMDRTGDRTSPHLVNVRAVVANANPVKKRGLTTDPSRLVSDGAKLPPAAFAAGRSHSPAGTG